jgi:hypothetical protein
VYRINIFIFTNIKLTNTKFVWPGLIWKPIMVVSGKLWLLDNAPIKPCDHIHNNPFSLQLTNWPNKLYCLSRERIYILVWSNTLAYPAHQLVTKKIKCCDYETWLSTSMVLLAAKCQYYKLFSSLTSLASLFIQARKYSLSQPFDNAWKVCLGLPGRSKLYNFNTRSLCKSSTTVSPLFMPAKTKLIFY